MGNQNGHQLSQAELGRRPTDAEMLVLLQLQRKLFTRLVLSPQHLALLQRYWESHFVNKKSALPFERVSIFWRTDGGCTSENPGDDLRSMGELGLQCLVFFAEKHPGESRMMKRAKGGYAFVKAAMAVARSLCEALYLVEEDGSPGKFPVTDTLYWQLIQSEEDFYRLFSLSFLLFEEIYCEELARDRTLPVTQQISTLVVTELVDATKARLLSQLHQAPLQLEDLRALCSNAGQILDSCSKDSVAPSPSKYSIARGRDRSASAPPDVEQTDRLSQWRRHHTARKSMREAAKSWSVTQEPTKAPTHSREATGGVAPRLVPRPPEIAFSSTSSQPIETGDLFEGLVTKASVPVDAHEVARAS